MDTQTEILPCLCSWGRKSGQWEETYQNPASSDYWSAGKTGEKENKQQDSELQFEHRYLNE